LAVREILLTLPPGNGNIPVECVELSMQNLIARDERMLVYYACAARRQAESLSPDQESG
jgi:hypothetical protein